ncbi:hypothetical protein CRG98_050428 [Punica granatum]|uniref:Uncharacterized protein n=1 Tax=Punica granatum TaxID=22663 RepID=A0A2I0GBK8_PUNGR|nr:hypothetical protein CRG98_050428 [Punica granatum]
MQQPQHGKTPQVIDPYPCPTQSFIQNQPWKPYVIHTMLYMASFVVAQPFPQAQPPVDVQPPATARPRHILPMLVQQPVTSHNLPPQGQVNLHQQQYVKPQIQQLLHEKEVSTQPPCEGHLIEEETVDHRSSMQYEIDPPRSIRQKSGARRILHSFHRELMHLSLGGLMTLKWSVNLEKRLSINQLEPILKIKLMPV